MYMILESDVADEHLMAAKGSPDGQHKQKSQHPCTDRLMPFDVLLNSAAAEPKKIKMSSMVKMKKSGKKKSQVSRRKMKVERSKMYYVVSTMINAQSGITFCPLWKGEAHNAKWELYLLLNKFRLKLGVIGESLDNLSGNY